MIRGEARGIVTLSTRKRTVMALALLSLAACNGDNDAQWSNGTFAGETTSTVGQLVVTVYNGAEEDDLMRVDVNSLGSCTVSATIAVTGNVMRVTPGFPGSPSCFVEDITLMRINDHVARTVFRGATVEMRKR